MWQTESLGCDLYWSGFDGQVWEPGDRISPSSLAVSLSLSGMRHCRRESNRTHDAKTGHYTNTDRTRHIALLSSWHIEINTVTLKRNTMECLSVRSFSGAVYTLAALFSWYMDGSSAGFPAAHLVAPISSARALATSRTAFIRTTWRNRAGVNANTMVRVAVYLQDPGVRI